MSSKSMNSAVHKEFFTEFNIQDYLSPIFESSAKATSEQKQIIEVLQHSLRSIINVISLPRIIALSHYLQLIFDGRLKSNGNRLNACLPHSRQQFSVPGFV